MIRSSAKGDLAFGGHFRIPVAFVEISQRQDARGAASGRELPHIGRGKAAAIDNEHVLLRQRREALRKWLLDFT